MIRLAKKIAQSGIASRREAERLIEKGKVSVDGQIVTTPVFFVDDNSCITVNGKILEQTSSSLCVWKMYKPQGYVTTRFDPQGRKTVFDLFPETFDRVIYIGRLDINSEGLLLFTNDGQFSRKLELPSTGVPRTYKVRFRGALKREHIQEAKNKLVINKIIYKNIEIKLQKNDLSKTNKWALVTLKEGKNREIRKIFEYFGCEVNRLIRVSYGPIKLGDLKKGTVERFSSNELKQLLELIEGN